jgi:hypothetical protein
VRPLPARQHRRQQRRRRGRRMVRTGRRIHEDTRKITKNYDDSIS